MLLLVVVFFVIANMSIIKKCERKWPILDDKLWLLVKHGMSDIASNITVRRIVPFLGSIEV